MSRRAGQLELTPVRALVLISALSVSGGSAEARPPEPRVDLAAQGRTAAPLENGSFTAELGGFSIHYEVHGSGPVLMTVPNSWGLSLGGLRALYRPLEERLTLVYFDPRGMGGSGPVRVDEDMGMAAVRSDFDALRRHLGLGRVHAIGWSNGAMNLILLAAERPEILEGAIFLHGIASFGPEDADDWEERYPELLASLGAFREEVADEEMSEEEKTARQRKLWLEVFFPLMFADPDAGRARLPELFADAQFSRRHAVHAERETPAWDFRDRLPAIVGRSLVISGAHDMTPASKGRELADGIAGATFLLFEESGHFAPVEEPEAFREAVWEFLGSTSRPPRSHSWCRQRESSEAPKWEREATARHSLGKT